MLVDRLGRRRRWDASGSEDGFERGYPILQGLRHLRRCLVTEIGIQLKANRQVLSFLATFFRLDALKCDLDDRSKNWGNPQIDSPF